MRKLRQYLYIARVLSAARDLQDFLWGGPPGRTLRDESWPGWIATLRKRTDKLDKVDRTNGQWRVEVRKRLLQTAAISIAMIEWIDQGYGDSEVNVRARTTSAIAQWGENQRRAQWGENQRRAQVGL